MVSRYWFEDLANIACDVEIASEFRYRKSVVRHNSLLITLSQSGETADTLAALRATKERSYLGSLAICNIANSSLVRESDLVLMTNAGTEIGVASTKAFTTQLTVLLMLVVKIGLLHDMNSIIASKIIISLELIPRYIKEMLSDAKISEMREIAGQLAEKSNVLFLGRGIHYPIAMEGALKLKEISYIHAEAHAAGELKHGPLALVDHDTPVIILAPKNNLLNKVRSNIEEIQARGGVLYIFTAQDTVFRSSSHATTIVLPHVDEIIAPIIYTVPLQLLAYYTAVIKGNDVDQPRNLAKSVTVE
jgi:glucosamine--fructose-6-phosphate aminotransferase (isomerizing)